MKLLSTDRCRRSCARAVCQAVQFLCALQAPLAQQRDVRTIDLAAASRAGVLVTRATPGFGAAVAEWIVGALLDLNRGLSVAVLDYRAGKAPKVTMGRELRGSVVGIVGYGTIGLHLAALLTAFGARMLVTDPHVNGDAESQVECVAFDQLLASSDHVVCLAPALLETRHMLDVGMAADQMPSPGLAAHSRVIATPHIAGLTPGAAHHQAMDTVRQVEALARGLLPDGALNPDQALRLQLQLPQ